MTVAELKDALRSKGLPVSGRKAELLKRLRASKLATAEEVATTSLPLSDPSPAPPAEPTPVMMGTIEVDCGSCGQRLSAGLSRGSVPMPVAGTEQDLATPLPTVIRWRRFLTNTPQPVPRPCASTSPALPSGVLAILVFMGGLGQLGPDPENCTEIEMDGEMVMSCTGGGFMENPEALNYVGFACCLLVPIAVILPVVAQAVRPPPLVTHQPTHAQHGAAGPSDTEAVVEWDTPLQRLVGAVSLLFGGSLVLATVVLAIGVVVLFVLALMALGSMG